ncbi:hypothetical protein C8R45DRAFT_1065823 [Mycena sanguinolenta]|nr:hypothetical protein C8R45DRAFT_1065823 [Mycena sanguinolenta]
MSSVPEASLSLLTQSNSTSIATPWTVLLALVVAGVALYYASPLRLICVLVSAIAKVENAYLTAVENGILCTSTDAHIAERLMGLQFKVSTIREASLRNSLSPLFTVCETFNIRRSVAVLRCLLAVRRLGTYIEISNESQLRDVASASGLHCQCPIAIRTTVALRRRDCPTPMCA